MNVHLETDRYYRADIHLSWLEERVENDGDLAALFRDTYKFEDVRVAPEHGEHMVTGRWPGESKDVEFSDSHVRSVTPID